MKNLRIRVLIFWIINICRTSPTVPTKSYTSKDLATQRLLTVDLVTPFHRKYKLCSPSKNNLFTLILIYSIQMQIAIIPKKVKANLKMKKI